jgi:hypothetical protein
VLYEARAGGALVLREPSVAKLLDVRSDVGQNPGTGVQAGEDADSYAVRQAEALASGCSLYLGFR